MDADGNLGFRRHRSHDIVPVDVCLIAHPLVRDCGATAHTWVDREAVEVVASPSHEGSRAATSGGPSDKPGHITERAAGRDWRVSGSGFWQVHPGAADALVDAVLGVLDVTMGESALDLYSESVCSPGCSATGSVRLARWWPWSHRPARCRDARRNLHDLPQVRLVHTRVDRWLSSTAAPAHTDVVVLDPPRSGAGRPVVDAVASLTLGSSRTSHVTRRPWAATPHTCAPPGMKWRHCGHSTCSR